MIYSNPIVEKEYRMNTEDTVEKACLIAMLNKDPNESIIDVQMRLMKLGIVNMLESKQIFLTLIKKKKLITAQFNQLTVMGYLAAIEAEHELKHK